MIGARSRYRTAAGLLLLVALFGLLVILVNPLHNFPVGDDWEYARTVQRLVTTGQFYRSPLVQATAFFPALWGGLFAYGLGFSFTALRLSTLPLAAGTLAAFYLMLGELGYTTGRRLLGALTLMVAPLFVFYAFSFNTEVPFLFWLLLGLWFTLRGLRLGRLGWLLAGSACGAVAFLTRQIGLALPAAAALVVVGYRPRSDWPAWLGACLGLPVLAVISFYGWQAVAHQTSWADTAITGQGTLQFLVNPQLPAVIARRVVLMLVTLVLYMAPLWLVFVAGWRQAWRALNALSLRLKIVGALLAVFLLVSVAYFGARGEWWPYFQESLTRAGLGPSLAFFAYPNDRRPAFLPMPVWIIMTLIGALLAAALVLNLVVRVVGGLREPAATTLKPGTDGPKPDARNRTGRLTRALVMGGQAVGPLRATVYLTFLALMAAVLVFPLIYARYFLPLLPASIILLLEATRRLSASPALGFAGLLVVGLLSVGLMWDSWNWHAVRWDNSQALVAHGVPLEKLDAGYEWSGWHLSDEAYAYLQAHHRPLITDPWQAVIDPEYMVTFTVVPGYHVAQVWPFYNPFRPNGADHLLLLRRGAAP